MRRERDQGPQAEKTSQAKTWHLGQQLSGARTGKRGGGVEEEDSGR